MKKILVILSSLTLIGVYAPNIVSFNNVLEENNIVNINMPRNDLDSIQIKTLTKDSQIINDLLLSLDLDNPNTTKQNIEFQVQLAINSIQFQTVQGVDYEIQGIQYNSWNRPMFGGRYTVKALPTSKLITGEFYLHLWKSFTFNYPTSGTIEDGEYIKNQIRNDIQSSIPTAVEGQDYRFVDLSDNDTERWMFSPNVGSDIRGRFVFLVAKEPLKDISRLGFTIDINDANAIRINIESQIFFRIWTISRGAQLGVDYQIEPIPYNRNNRPTQAGKFLVSALPTSKLIAGSFKVRLQKTLNLDYAKSGNNLESNTVKNRVINEIRRWKPTSIEGQDYHFINLKNGSWQIITASNADVIANFNFTVILEDITGLVIRLDADQVTKNDIEAKINQEISKIIPGIVLGTDYQITTIPYGSNDRPAQAGIFKVSALPNSSLITGSFDLHLQKKLTFNYPTSGTKVVGEVIKNRIIAEIRRWNPNVIEGKDYRFIYLADSDIELWIFTTTNGSDVKGRFIYTIEKTDKIFNLHVT